MKWFKHFADSLDDPFIQELMDEFSHAGYVAYFGLIEIIAKENGKEITGKIEISPKYLKRKLRISTTKLQQIFDFCSKKPQQKSDKTSTKPKLLCDFSKEKWILEIPKLLELKDNYTKDLEVPDKKPSGHKEVEKYKEEVEKEKKKPEIKPEESKDPQIEKEQIYLEELKNKKLSLRDYLLHFPKPEIEQDVKAVILAIKETNQPGVDFSKAPARKNDIEDWTRFFLFEDYSKDDILKAIEAGIKDEFWKDKISIDYLTNPNNIRKLLHISTIKEQPKVSHPSYKVVKIEDAPKRTPEEIEIRRKKINEIMKKAQSL